MSIEKYDGKEFLRQKVSDIMSGNTQIRIECLDPQLPISVRASKAGVEIGDVIAHSLEDLRLFEDACPEDFELEEWARLIATAWKIHLQMRPKLNRSQKDVDL